MAEVASASPADTSGLFNGHTGGRAPFKAEYVSTLVSQVVHAEIDQLVRMQSLQNKFSRLEKDTVKILDKLVEALRPDSPADHPNMSLIDGTKYEASKLKIGIIGGGIAGLYSAYILKFLGIDYEILEANPDRMGGRIYTHYFCEKKDKMNEEDKHDYYDIGAMRFPHSPIMQRTFDLFERLGMGAPNKPRTAESVLIPYYLVGQNCPTRYNDVTARLGQNEKERFVDPKTGKETQDKPDDMPDNDSDPFKVSTKNGGTVPASRVSHNVTAEILSDAYDRFRRKIKAAQKLTEKARKEKNPTRELEAAEARQRAYEYLMRHDRYSLREYLQTVEGYDADTCHWLETIDSASGWYDMAFTENVFESLAFGYDDADNKTEEKKPGTAEKEKPSQEDEDQPSRWYCIEGGTVVTIDRIIQKLDAQKIFQGKMVTKLALKPKQQEDRVTVTMQDCKTKAEEIRHYSAIINTTTLGALQKIDLTDMELPYGMKTAIRVLRYDTSTKVGVKFKKMWWKDAQFDSIKLGGVGKTDLPIRVCVYPSYNIHDQGPGVLLASYTWGQDSERIAAHVSTESPDNDKGLKELVIYNLARLHTINREKETREEYEKRFLLNKKTITDNWITHHAYDWSKDQYACGGFALFSPGQFSTLIPHLVRPASDSRFVIVGEAASANHAWIVGALDSAFRGLKQILTRFQLDDLRVKMEEEFGDVDELKQEVVAKQVLLATLTEDQMAELRVGRTGVVGLVPQGSM